MIPFQVMTHPTPTHPTKTMPQTIASSTLYFEVCYGGDCLLELQASDLPNAQSILEALFDDYDEEYDLSDAYDEASEWVTELTLSPVYND